MQTTKTERLPLIQVDYMAHGFGEWIKNIQAQYPTTLFLEKIKQRFVCKIETKDGYFIVGSYDVKHQRQLIIDRRKSTSGQNQYRRDSDEVPMKVSIPNEFLRTSKALTK